MKITLKEALYAILVGKTVLVDGNKLVWNDPEIDKTITQVLFSESKPVDDDMQLIYGWLEDNSTFELWEI